MSLVVMRKKILISMKKFITFFNFFQFFQNSHRKSVAKMYTKKSCSTRHFPTISIVIRLKLYKLDLHPTSKRKLCTQQTVLIHQFKQDLTCTYETM